MAISQTITITDNRGDTYSTAEELMTKMTADLPTMDTPVAMIESCTADGTLLSMSELTEDGTGATVTRIWDDACWVEFQALSALDSTDFTDAGWTVVSESNTVGSFELPDSGQNEGVFTRQDDDFQHTDGL